VPNRPGECRPFLLDTGMSANPFVVDPVVGNHWLSRFMRSRTFAWIVSVLLHVALFILFYQLGFARTGPSRRVIIPEARLAAGPVAENAAPSAPVKLAETPRTPTAVAPSALLDELPLISVDAAEPSAADLAPSPALALPGVDPVGAGSVAGGAGPVGPVCRFFGQPGNAYKIVYVVDVSASLMIYVDLIVAEMNESIRDLVPTQEFHIVLAMPGHVREFGARRLVPANTRYKTAAYDFIRVLSKTPEPGRADPIEAMKRAFAAQPELIYFLTDGDYADVESEFEAVLKRLNAHGDVKITVIGFSPSPAPRALLERIAKVHGGNCRFVEPK